MDQMREAQRALETPLFSGLPGDIEVSFEFFPPKNEKMGESPSSGRASPCLG